MRWVRLPRAEAEGLVPRLVSLLHAALGAIAYTAVWTLHMKVPPRGTALAVG